VFADDQDKLYAIVACSDVKTSQVPPHFDPLREKLTSWNCPVLSTWLSQDAKTVLLPPELPDFGELSDNEISDLVFPLPTWNEHFIVQALPPKGNKTGKYLYKNPCDKKSFLKSASKLNSLKKCSESESDARSKLLSTESAKILIPAQLRKKAIIGTEGKK
jgi:hypothetical protein